ncbi:MAG TPA: hypothetical protein VF841_09585 [Anaeromyxobacter sp.]
MRHVTIRSRADGITELAPTLQPLAPGERLIVISAVLFVTSGLFISGLVPAGVAAAVAASCVAGEVVLGVKALALALFRPLAPVVEVSPLELRRRAR